MKRGNFMFNFIKNKILNIDNSIKSLVKSGSIFSLSILFLATIVLFTYEAFYSSPLLYTVGILVFRTGITYLSTFFAFGFAFNEIKNQI